ncbi:HNH endonuclease [Luteimonas aestuarii]|uniref:HNH endonuclease n=1 Tax=Luteimonas aestuarii TaxID=453837 RepID=A0A4R5TJ32_9GAMM|nr:HNH endonuclease signature motif containing protein [Luteimonas aestuarii]TDK21060.1 HNH endonuclease [Luteimonas aestuarii]
MRWRDGIAGVFVLPIPFEIGALYRRRRDIHGLYGGQQQGGISTPAKFPVVIAFTGEAGHSHGYSDKWESEVILRYYGEGQQGHMTFSGGNRAIRDHVKDGKQLLLFQMMGHGKPCRYLGEFVLVGTEIDPRAPDTTGRVRNAIVFRLTPKDADSSFFSNGVRDRSPEQSPLDTTSTQKLVEVRKKQSLFRRQLITVEKGCRLTGVQDLRFLRASHIKPWADCKFAEERTDGHNGLLLTPHADLLFDRGWISFDDNGELLRSGALPDDVEKRLALKLRPGRKYGEFSVGQQRYLEHHRKHVFEQKFKRIDDPVEDLIQRLS